MKVLNAGYVRLVEYMGGDESVIRNARRCWRSEDKSSERSDRNLIRHLLQEGHMTPFETIVFTFDEMSNLCGEAMDETSYVDLMRSLYVIVLQTKNTLSPADLMLSRNGSG